MPSSTLYRPPAGGLLKSQLPTSWAVLLRRKVILMAEDPGRVCGQPRRGGWWPQTLQHCVWTKAARISSTHTFGCLRSAYGVFGGPVLRRQRGPSLQLV